MDSLAAAVGFSYRHMACTNSQSLDSNFAGIFVQLVARVLALEVVNKLMKVCYEQTICQSQSCQHRPSHTATDRWNAREEPLQGSSPGTQTDRNQRTMTHRNQKKTKGYTFRRQFNQKPSSIPGCPSILTHAPVEMAVE